MREMKFRAWHKPSSAMMMVHTLHWNGNGECIGGYCHDDEWNEIAFDVTHTIIMQFTGLHDKQGREIYEGDVLQYTDNYNRPITGQVQYLGNGFWIEEKDETHYMPNDREVIGNVYENPELVGGTQKEEKEAK